MCPKCFEGCNKSRRTLLQDDAYFPRWKFVLFIQGEQRAQFNGAIRRRCLPSNRFSEIFKLDFNFCWSFYNLLNGEIIFMEGTKDEN